jgi:hypothetical protein
MATYDVVTDLDPSMLTAVAADTFRKWALFALGKSSLGGHTLVNPSGRYAASLSWKKTGVASVAIMSDSSVAPEANWLEDGHSAFSMKDKMLGGPGTKVSKAGYRYRIIPMRGNATRPSFNLKDTVTSKKGERMPAKAASMWVKARTSIGSDRFATMSDKPGSSMWVVPPMPAYSPAAILADSLRKQYGQKSGVGS